MSNEWKKLLLPASFRGIPFFVDAHELSGGRSAVQHEPPGKDKVNTEDIGRKTKTYRVEGHVLGDNYFFIRDGLIKAMEDGSKGILIHPYLGLKEVQPGPYSVRETTDEGRVGRFDFTFYEAGAPSFPFAAIDAVMDVLTTAVVTVAQVQNAFQLAFKLAELPGLLYTSAILLVKDFLKTIKNGIKNVKLKQDKQAELVAKIEELENNLDALVANPATMASEFAGLIGMIGDSVADPIEASTFDTASGVDDKLKVFDPLLAFAAPEIPDITPTNKQEKANAAALVGMINGLAMVELAKQSVAKEYVSLEDAAAQRESVSLVIEDLASRDISDDLYASYKDFLAKFVEALPNTALPEIKEITLNQPTPALVLAYDLYEDAGRETDIISRNRARNPGFLNGTIEVLSE